MKFHFDFQKRGKFKIKNLPPDADLMFFWTLVQHSGREPMPREPHVPLFKTESGSLARRKILSDCPHSIAKQRLPRKLPSKVST